MQPVFYLLLLLPPALLATTLWGNRVILFAPPGPLARLRVYLGRNRACTHPEHPFAELREPRFPEPPERLEQRLEGALTVLGWHWRRLGPGHVHAEVRTPLFGFVDDLEARVEPAPGGSRLALCSRSRTGRADFGANQRHLRELIDAVRRLRA